MAKKLNITETREFLRAQKLYNDYEFFGDEPYIYRVAAVSMHSACWKVTQRGVDLNDGKGAWYDRGNKSFIIRDRSDVKPALARAQAWAAEWFGTTVWAKGPFGGYGDADFIYHRLEKIFIEGYK